jgi:hypothetical protein
MLVWEIQAQYAAALESGDTDTIEILQAEAREIAKADAVAISEADGDEVDYISEATSKTTPRSPRSRK